VGGVAVIGSLIYLGLQVRQNVMQLKVNSYQTATIGYGQRIQDIATDEALSRVFRYGLESFERLSPGDQFRFHGLLVGLLTTFQNNLNLYQSRVLPEGEFQVYLRDIVALLKSPGATVWWNQAREFHSPQLRSHLDHALRSLGPQVPPLSDIPFLSPDDRA
jgi:hypothetical protein